ncbi:uroplakin-1a [Trichomycterus rosablanca]|uniref:uroplakin-1a n=1 Tax=Trichomycterus rosablanca TaxID=2290929 RepID=UPI002F35CDBF
MGNEGVTCLMVFLIILNVFGAAAGLALMAVAIWVTVDAYKLYPISGVSGKDDIFAGAWIAIFTGFAYFCVCIFGILAALKRKRSFMLAYLILMFIVFIFECASCITVVTNRDYLVGNSNLVKKQMLMYYGDNSDAGNKITNTWNKVMQDVQCCGTDGPLDWIEYNSSFRQMYGTTYPWPLTCCKRQSTFDVSDPEGCKIGQTSAMFNKGCFGHIEFWLSRYTWAIGWLGFAIQMFMFFLMIVAMVYYVKLE